MRRPGVALGFFPNVPSPTTLPLLRTFISGMSEILAIKGNGSGLLKCLDDSPKAGFVNQCCSIHGWIISYQTFLDNLVENNQFSIFRICDRLCTRLQSLAPLKMKHLLPSFPSFRDASKLDCKQQTLVWKPSKRIPFYITDAFTNYLCTKIENLATLALEGLGKKRDGNSLCQLKTILPWNVSRASPARNGGGTSNNPR